MITTLLLTSYVHIAIWKGRLWEHNLVWGAVRNRGLKYEFCYNPAANTQDPIYFNSAYIDDTQLKDWVNFGCSEVYKCTLEECVKLYDRLED